MNESGRTSRAEAEQTLAALSETVQRTNDSVNQSLFGSALMSLFYGGIIAFYGTFEHDNDLAPLAMMGCVIGFVGTAWYHVWRAKLLGISVSLTPTNRAQWKWEIIFLSVSVLAILLSPLAFEHVHRFAPFVVGAVLSCVMFYFVRRYPQTGLDKQSVSSRD